MNNFLSFFFKPINKNFFYIFLSTCSLSRILTSSGSSFAISNYPLPDSFFVNKCNSLSFTSPIHVLITIPFSY